MQEIEEERELKIKKRPMPRLANKSKMTIAIQNLIQKGFIISSLTF